MGEGSNGNESQHVERQPGPQDETPKLGVHVLTEFMFCPRAGVLEYERAREDFGQQEDRVARLDYQPDYTVALIEAEMASILSRFARAGTWAVGALVLLLVIALVIDFATAVILGLAAVSAWAPWAWRLFREYLRLHARRRRALSASGREPDANIAAVQQVNWWELLKADFDPVERREANYDPGLRLSGKPSMVLLRGAVCIPVFRKHHGDRTLHPQHHARMAAYAHLLKTCERVQVPYGVILFGDGEQGVSVPITDYAVKQFEQGLADARELLLTLQRQPVQPDRPTKLSACGQCHLGRPRLYRPGKSETVLGDAVLEPRLTEARKTQKEYHSDCGDRYSHDGWTPPHELAVALGLTD